MIHAKQKIAIFVCNDVTGLLVLNRTLKGIKDLGYKPVIFNTGDHRNRRFKVPTPPVVNFFNTRLLRDVITPILEQGTSLDQRNFTYWQLARMHGIDYHEITDVNDAAFVSAILSDDSYCGALAVRFLQLFDKDIIDAFHKKGFFWNLHSGLLPYYKGLLTPFRALDNGEKTWGMTLHDLTVGIDEGGIIQRCERPLDPESPVLDLYISTAPLGAKMVLDNLAVYKKAGKISICPQETDSENQYFTNPTAQELKKYMAKGIIYADPYYMLERLVKLFAVEGTPLSAELKRALLLAISSGTTPPAILSKNTQSHLSA